MSIKLNGLDNLQKQLKKMQKTAKELNGTHKVPFDKLFTKSFMTKYTKFSSINDFFKSGGFDVKSENDLKAIPDNEIDLHTSKTTKFKTWEDMLNKAVDQYISKKFSF